MTFCSVTDGNLDYCSRFLDRDRIFFVGASVLITGGRKFLTEWLSVFILWQKQHLRKQIRLYLLSQNVVTCKKKFKATSRAPNDGVFLARSGKKPLFLDDVVKLTGHGYDIGILGKRRFRSERESQTSLKFYDG